MNKNINMKKTLSIIIFILIETLIATSVVFTLIEVCPWYITAATIIAAVGLSLLTTLKFIRILKKDNINTSK
ncbi:MAG: hypothetical protein RR316_03605 [Clostridia bacterium]